MTTAEMTTTELAARVELSLCPCENYCEECMLIRECARQLRALDAVREAAAEFRFVASPAGDRLRTALARVGGER